MPAKITKKTLAKALGKKKASKPGSGAGGQRKAVATNTYLLLDRSGSMDGNWAETLGAINAYARELSNKGVAGKITLATFDHVNGLKFEIIRDMAVGSWRDVTVAEITARGGTPLYDAVGRIVALADRDAPTKAVIAIMTDGYENASREVNQASAKALLDRCRGKDWQVVFLGADFDATAQAASVGTLRGQTMTMARGAFAASATILAHNTQLYAGSARGAGTINWSQSDRDIAAGIFQGNAAPRQRKAA